MQILQLSAKAQQFYEQGRPRNMISGYERNVLTRHDFDNCLFVDAEYTPQPGDTIFRCKTINQKTIISLKTSIPESENLVEISLKGKFTREEWLAMLEVTNGLIFSPELDPRQNLAGELDDDYERELIEKIEQMSVMEAKMLLREISLFWLYAPPADEFIARFI